MEWDKPHTIRTRRPIHIVTMQRSKVPTDNEMVTVTQLIITKVIGLLAASKGGAIANR